MKKYVPIDKMSLVHVVEIDRNKICYVVSKEYEALYLLLFGFEIEIHES